MPRFRLDIEYDGSLFAGWQHQADQPSVQQAIEQAIEKFCGQDVRIRAAGRTDAGVHASAQVAHVDLAKAWPGDKVRDAVNAHLQAAGARVAILRAAVVADGFDARFSATGRAYRFRILNRRARPRLQSMAAASICRRIPHTDLVSDREKSGGDRRWRKGFWPRSVDVRGG